MIDITVQKKNNSKLLLKGREIVVAVSVATD